MHLVGVKSMTLEQLKSYHSTKTDSLCPGHPEIENEGVEATTGPLGQGVANAVGLAMATKNLAATYNKPGYELVNNMTWCMIGDGCLQEGVGLEAVSLAGHWRLNNLCIIYDNSITCDGTADVANTEDMNAKMRTTGWNVLDVFDGDSDVAAIVNALIAARSSDKPTFINIRTTIGFGSSKAGNAKTHGAALGVDDVVNIKKSFGLDPSEHFHIPQDVYDLFSDVRTRGDAYEAEWQKTLQRYKKEDPVLGTEFGLRVAGKMPDDWTKCIPEKSELPAEPTASRKSAGIVTNILGERIKSFLVGTADLTPSCNVAFNNKVDFQSPDLRTACGLDENYSGRYIHYGIREHAMCAISNGLAAFNKGTFIPMTSSFFMFYLYAAPAVRMAALQGLQQIHIATHDSIGTGELREREASCTLNSPSPTQGTDDAENQPDLQGTADYQDTFPAPAETSVTFQLHDSIEIPQDDHPPNVDFAFAASPLARSQVSLLNISPFEWYDLLAQDAISQIQRWNDTSNGEPRWNFDESTLCRRQSPAPISTDAADSHAHHRHDDNLGASFLDQGLVDKPWNTTKSIELSAEDLGFFRYYTEIVGPILDLFDQERHFTNVVPHLALRNLGLLKAILAVAAKHMSLGLKAGQAGSSSSPEATTGSGQPSERSPTPAHMATQYYYETLQYLSQTPLYPSYAKSHEILATAIMIGTYEMFDADGTSTSGNWERHLRGAFWIQRSQDNDGESIDGLRRAVWWAWLRQDIWAAFRSGRPTLTIWRPLKRLEDLDSDELATRMVYICAKCVGFAALDKTSPDQDIRQRIEQGNRFLQALEDWYRVLPSSYKPVTVETKPDQTSKSETKFQSIWFHPPNHAGAMQMYHFARAIVLLNQPTTGGLNAYRQQQKCLNESLRMICSIANACREGKPAMAFVNVQAIFAVGQCVQMPEKQAELLDILDRMLEISKFPASGLVEELKKVWQE
ncbi:hypothetical protein CEP54_011389 [Fusarium duplospermum]|uniref:Transketolase-like pyrimidine-binding domain-containing protein n=1 Tax=Fusarium duplospermum TaxID=1325734 RepID=A0A428PET1_9HYPO|nr:hypothetical protein CEP54_011389 [Fusarium duplospermum]